VIEMPPRAFCLSVTFTMSAESSSLGDRVPDPDGPAHSSDSARKSAKSNPAAEAVSPQGERRGLEAALEGGSPLASAGPGDSDCTPRAPV
jgi:hypothetical protein